jgi:hypothetical protein
MGLRPPLSYMPAPDLMPFFCEHRFCPPRETPTKVPGVMGPAPKNFKLIFGREVNQRGQALTVAVEKRQMLLGRRSHSGPTHSSGAAGVCFGGGPGPGAVPFTNCPRRRERGRDERGKFTAASIKATGKSAGYLSRRVFAPRRIILCRSCNQDRLFKKELTKSLHPWHNGRG